MFYGFVKLWRLTICPEPKGTQDSQSSNKKQILRKLNDWQSDKVPKVNCQSTVWWVSLANRNKPTQDISWQESPRMKNQCW
jgi:hypothetical protein